MGRSTNSVLVMAVVTFGLIDCGQDQSLGVDRSPADPSYRNSSTGPDVMEFDPDSWAWTARPLIIFADRADSPTLETQRKALQLHAADLAERDVAIVEIIENHLTVDGEPRTVDLNGIKRRYDIPPDAAFAVRLVGKDTGIKLRRSEPVTLEEVFSLIDSMPMRRQEMRDMTR